MSFRGTGEPCFVPTDCWTQEPDELTLGLWILVRRILMAYAAYVVVGLEKASELRSVVPCLTHPHLTPITPALRHIAILRPNMPTEDEASEIHEHFRGTEEQI